MRRKKLEKIVYDDYLNASLEDQEILQERVFEYYYDRNDCDLDLALDEINADLYTLERTESYERCAMLKHILQKFE
jgi:hypothetical protein